MGKKKVKQSKQKIEVMGTVTEALKGGRFKVELDDGHEVGPTSAVGYGGTTSAFAWATVSRLSFYRSI